MSQVTTKEKEFRAAAALRRAAVQVSVVRRYHFEAGHFLPKVPAGHKCAHQHGHNYEMEIEVGGELGESGMLIDFFALDKLVQPILDAVDHKNLNDVPGLENPTAENIAVLIAGVLGDSLADIHPPLKLSSVVVFETKDCWAKAVLW